jgi:hypothetical protein
LESPSSAPDALTFFVRLSSPSLSGFAAPFNQSHWFQPQDRYTSFLDAIQEVFGSVDAFFGKIYAVLEALFQPIMTP